MRQLEGITITLILVVMGLFMGVKFIEEARMNQVELSKVTPMTLEMDYLTLPIHRPMKVKPGEYYTVEVFLEESVNTWVTTNFTEPLVLTTSLVIDPHFVHRIGDHVVTTTLKPKRSIALVDSTALGFQVRKDTFISDALEMGLHLDVEDMEPKTAKFTMPVYEEGDLWREHWWRILWFIISLALLAVVLAMIGINIRPVGIVEVLLAIIATSIWYPELLEMIKLVLRVLKEIL